MKAQKLRSAGQRDFERMVEQMRIGELSKSPAHLLQDQLAVEKLGFDVEVKEGGFSSRQEMGEHLVAALAGVDRALFIGDRGFWDWLALQWFDDLCPVKASGERKPSEAASYVMSEDYKRRYRHAVYVTWQLVETHGENARFLLFKEPSVRGELTEQLMARQYYLSCCGLIEAVKRLYWDESTGSLKRGAGGKGAGSPRRLVGWLQQIEVTFDLHSMSADQLLALIPDEFGKFLK